MMVTMAVKCVSRAEGSAGDEVHPNEENRRADERGSW